MLYKTTNKLGFNTFCHFCLFQIDIDVVCYYHNIMTFCSEDCFDLWLKETPEEHEERNRRMVGIMIDGRIKN